MQRLEVVARLFPQVLSGEKTSTIRWREATIVPGPMMYVCQDDPHRTAIVEVTRCTPMPLREVASFLDKTDVWPDDVMLAGMREHYPTIGLSDRVDVIEHKPADRRTLSIATLALETGGRIGVCRLPGLHGDLDCDLAQIKQWSPSIVLSMTEQAEMGRCGNGELGSRLGREGINWAHLPVRDFASPDGEGAAGWADLSERLHDLLDQGEGVLLHCRGGQGRSGMIALRLLVERGLDAAAALKWLRRERPGAVETREQLAWASMVPHPPD